METLAQSRGLAYTNNRDKTELNEHTFCNQTQTTSFHANLQKKNEIATTRENSHRPPEVAVEYRAALKAQPVSSRTDGLASLNYLRS